MNENPRTITKSAYAKIKIPIAPNILSKTFGHLSISFSSGIENE